MPNRKPPCANSRNLAEGGFKVWLRWGAATCGGDNWLGRHPAIVAVRSRRARPPHRPKGAFCPFGWQGASPLLSRSSTHPFSLRTIVSRRSAGRGCSPALGRAIRGEGMGGDRRGILGAGSIRTPHIICAHSASA